MKESFTIGFPHPAAATGGPGSFQSRFIIELRKLGHRVVYPNSRERPDIILVVAGTARIDWLINSKLRGSRIIHRLDGINWRHKIYSSSIRHYIICEIRNWLMRFERDRLADHVIYQSYFIRNWWHKKYGQSPCPESVIYNGVDLSLFRPSTIQSINEDVKPVLLCVEGNVHDDPITIELLRTISKELYSDGTIKKILICGGLSRTAKEKLDGVDGICLLGKVPRDKMHTIYDQGDFFLCLELNPPCPNSVIEALASGLPVVGFDTGSLKELVGPESGMIIPYKGDQWKMETPDILGMVDTIRKVVYHLSHKAKAARNIAEQKFGIDKMIDSYLAVFQSVSK